MRMTDQYGIDMRQVRNRQPRSLMAFGSGKRKWGGAVFEYGIGQDVQAGSGLQQKAGMAYPGQRRLIPVRV